MLKTVKVHSPISSSSKPKLLAFALPVVTLASTMAAAPALAHESHKHDEHEVQLETIVVTGSKIPKQTVELTHSVTVIDELDIKNQAHFDITEVLRKQVGVEFKQSGGPGQFNYMKLRGLPADNLLVVLDGVKINKGSSGNIGNLLSQLDLKTVESIEILRGPQATLYGGNNSAGVLVINTKSGHEASRSLGFEFGSMDWKKVNGSLRDSTMLGDGELVYSINASNTDSDNTHRYEFFEDTTYQGKLSYELDSLTIGVNGFHADNKFGYAELDETYRKLSSRAQHWAFQTPDPDQFSGTTQTVSNFFVEHKVSEQLTQKIQLGHTKNTYSINDKDNGLLGTQIAPVDGIVPGSVAGDTLYIYDRRWPGLSLTQLDLSDPANAISDVKHEYQDKSQQFNYDLLYAGEHHNIIAGIERVEHVTSETGSYGSVFETQRINSYYLNGDVHLANDSLTLAAGVRTDNHGDWGEHTTGNLGASWQFADNTSIYANIGTSFAPATVRELYNPARGNPELKPESGKTYELGIRQTAFDDDLMLEATYWCTEIDDVIFYDASIDNPNNIFNNGKGQQTNGLKGKTSGVELQASYQLTAAFSVDANYTYTDSHLKTRKTGPWERSAQVARNKANLGFNFSGEQLHAGINTYFSGPRLRWNRDVEMKKYVRVDASARYQFDDNFAVHARVENLFNDRIEEGLGYKEPGRYSVVGLDFNF